MKMNHKATTIDDLKEFLIIQLLREFDRIGRDLVNFNSWDKYCDLWFDALQLSITRIQKIDHPTEILMSIMNDSEEDDSEEDSEDSEEVTEGLKHCPFCGSEDVFFIAIVENGEVIDDAFEISCGTCQISFSCGDSTKQELAELWNRRDEK